MQIRPVTSADADAIAAILLPVIRAGETYALDRDMTETDVVSYWTAADRRTFVAVENGVMLGTYYLRANQAGGGAHVCNCGYMTAPAAAGQGVARAMAEHSFEQARAAGFRAMQFNFVVSTSTRAIRLWQSLGFAIVGTLPGAFDHPASGEVNAYVMYRKL